MAQGLLAGALPRRWAHVQGVAGKAERVAASLALSGDVLVAAAWLHDVGYAPEVTDTGYTAAAEAIGHAAGTEGWPCVVKIIRGERQTGCDVGVCLVRLAGFEPATRCLEGSRRLARRGPPVASQL